MLTWCSFLHRIKQLLLDRYKHLVLLFLIIVKLVVGLNELHERSLRLWMVNNAPVFVCKLPEHNATFGDYLLYFFDTGYLRRRARAT